jgi:PPIC-type PPIASE domain
MVGRNEKGAARLWRRLTWGAACAAGLAVVGYTGSQVLARPEAPAPAPKTTPAEPTPPTASPSDYGQRPVAFLHGNEAITREQLGEYLIARFGAEKLPLLINKIIIEEACREKKIEITPAEIEASLAQDLKGMGGITQADFVNNILKQYKKTLYEWKEDVIRPKLLLSKLVHDRVKVTDEEVQAAYDAYYGEKVACRMIFWPAGEEKVAQSQYASIRDSDDEFQRKATMQANPSLAAHAGEIPPIGHRTVGNDAVEKAAFRLQSGEMSPLVNTPEGCVVLRCDKRIPPDTSVSLKSVHDALYKDVFERKVQMEIPKAFAELRERANVNALLADPTKPGQSLADSTHQLLKDEQPAAPGKTPPMPAAH